MNIVLMMLRAPRPSRQDDMRAVAKPRWIRKGYDGLTFFGHIITHNAEEAEAFNACHTLTGGSKNGMLYFKNHEMITSTRPATATIRGCCSTCATAGTGCWPTATAAD